MAPAEAPRPYDICKDTHPYTEVGTALQPALSRATQKYNENNVLLRKLVHLTLLCNSMKYGPTPWPMAAKRKETGSSKCSRRSARGYGDTKLSTPWHPTFTKQCMHDIDPTTTPIPVERNADQACGSAAPLCDRLAAGLGVGDASEALGK